ncbi:succinate--CoA ligase subunit alpha [Cyanobacterium sp. uoEpiScrs1]|uniref:succinate--CoA ligase subunit alpha n=1 Tax=Cyanobacterium sp. uoEpiScrs1 TaxID=2976343 RepID=UPI00226A4890|nr:CoA-binding protein [Cyanobacterium sp. uoEpiScrs1]
MKWQADSKILIQGITTPLGSIYGKQMKAFGMNIVAGISTNNDSQKIDEIPIFNLVEKAVGEFKNIDISIIFTPPYKVLDAALEAMDSGIRQLVIVSGGVPPLDMIDLLHKAQVNQTFILGSGSQGLVIPDQFWLGICEHSFYTPGSVGIVSRCDRLVDEVAGELTRAKLGQSLVVSLGQDCIIGSKFEYWLQMLEADSSTQVIVLLGQGNSHAELCAVEYIASAVEKPVIAYITGLHTPIERTLLDAETIVSAQLSPSIIQISPGESIIDRFKKAKVKIAQHPTEIIKLVKIAISRKSFA